MVSLFDSQFFLLAEGNWVRFIGILVVFGFYAVVAIAKMLANRSKTDDGEDSGTSKAVELAKKYARQRQAQQQQTRRREVRNNEFTSDWDRRQELKRQQLARHGGLEEMPQVQPEPIRMVPVSKPQQPPRPKVTRQIPQYREVSALNRAMQATKQKKVVKKQPPPVRQTYQKSRRTVKTKEIPVAKIIKTPKPLDVLLRHPNQLRAAIILKEILDKPISMRETF